MSVITGPEVCGGCGALTPDVSWWEGMAVAVKSKTLILSIQLSQCLLSH